MLIPTRVLRASWSSTLHLPKSALPPRAPLPSPHLIKCTDELYAWQSERKTSERFILHDGPPYSNGSLHIGHALNKILKDIICRFQVAQGKRVQYIPGWDCHGLPIEVKALQALKVQHGAIGPVAVRKAAQALAHKTIKEQMKGFKEWAVMGDWDNAYKTMDASFELRQLAVFKQMVESGLIYRMQKPVYWSPSSQTALAEAELEYDPEHSSQCAFIRYPIVELSEKLKSIPGINPENLGALIWTTTPWTLPANRAIAVNSEMEYCIVSLERSPQSQFLVAKSRLEYLQSFMPDHTIKVIAESIPGADIAASVKYSNPMQASQVQPIIHADFVSPSSGSGLVHMAPGHGMEDYIICQQHGIDAFAPVDSQGKFTGEALRENPEILEGKSVQSEGTAAVLDYLQSLQRTGSNTEELVLATHKISHKYPIDWRTKEPVIVRATEQWFADIEGIKDDALKAIESVQFIPESGRARLESFIKGRTEWCISRQRAWGVPIPALYRIDKEPHEAIMTSSTIDHIMTVIGKRGINSWWTDADDEAAWIPPNLDGQYIRGRDTMDVWFDSGTSWTLLSPSADRPVADVYLEGTDQHRGWFQSSLLTHVAHQQASLTATKKAPFGTLITHGFTLDQDGRKMSKSLGNVISPSEIMSGSLLPPVKRKKQKTQGTSASAQPSYDAMGPDALRLWVAGCDFTKDVGIGQPVLQGVQQSLHKLRVTMKWLLGALSDFDPSSKPVASSTNGLLDRIALQQLSQVSHTVHSSFEIYNISKAVTAVNRYINQDLSAFYFETLKDRLYTGSKIERLSAQATLYHIFNELLAMLSSIVPLTVEEVWGFVPAQIQVESEHPLRRVWSPFTTSATQTGPESSEELETMTRHIVAVNAAVKAAQETARNEKKLGSGLESDVHLFFDSSLFHESAIANKLFSTGNLEMLASAFVVSKVFIHIGKRPEKERLLDENLEVLAELKFCLEEGWHDSKKTTTDVVRIVKPSGEKCGRCWRYLEIKTEALCGRCEDVVKKDWPQLLES